MDYTSRDEAAQEVRQHWEMVSVTTGIHYLNGAIANVGDDAKFITSHRSLYLHSRTSI